MRVVVLSDNRALKTDFETEHGLSVYLEADNYNCLLDVGASDLFARNAKLMNIDWVMLTISLSLMDMPII